MDITLIAIIFFVLVAVVFLLLFLFKSTNKKTFVADDGSVFQSQLDLDIYKKLFEKTKPLFSKLDDDGSNSPIIGFEKSFLIKLTSEGFRDLKTLVKFRKQLKSLSDLINV